MMLTMILVFIEVAVVVVVLLLVGDNTKYSDSKKTFNRIL